jgi:hypothetical protein
MYTNLCKDVYFTCKVQFSSNNIIDFFFVSGAFVISFVLVSLEFDFLHMIVNLCAI